MPTLYENGEHSGDKAYADKPPVLPAVAPYSSAPALFSMSEEEKLNRRRPLTKKVRTSLARHAARGGDTTMEDVLADKIVDMAVEGNPKMIEMVWAYSDGKPMQNIDLGSGGNPFTGIVIVNPTAPQDTERDVAATVDANPPSDGLPF